MLNQKVVIAGAVAALAAALTLQLRPVTPTPDAVPTPARTLSMRTALSHYAVSTSGTDNVWANVDITAAQVTTSREHPPLDIALLYDVSSSMHGEKILAARIAARSLTAQMRPQDRIAVVAFSSEATVFTELTHVTDAARVSIDGRTDTLEPSGATNISDALDMGLAALDGARPEATRAMFLISDGEPTVGVRDPRILARRAATALQERNIALTTLGMGDDFDESVLGSMAVSGGGNFYYADTPQALKERLDVEWRGLTTAVARQVTVRLTAADGVRIKEVHGFSTQRDGNTTVVYVDTMFSGSRRSMMVELETSAQNARRATPLIDVKLSYDDLTDGHDQALIARDQLIADVVSRDIGTADVFGQVMARALVVESMQAINASDQLWGRGAGAQARALLDEQRAKNQAFSAHSPHPSVDEASANLLQAHQQTTEVIQEKRQIRIRKKRKAATIEIIAGDL